MPQPFSFTIACLAALLALPASGAADADPVEKKVRQILLEQLEKQGLREVRVDLSVLPARSAQRCAKPLEVELVDSRQPARMRARARCADPLWQADFIVRATISARVAVAAGEIAANRPLSAEDLDFEQRTLASPERALSDAAAIIGKTSRRSLRAGAPIDRSALVEAVLVHRGAPVTILARSEGIQASMPGVALEAGRRGDLIAVRNANTRRQIRCRVIGADEVEAVADSTSQSPD